MSESKMTEDAYKPAITLAALAGASLSLAVRFGIWTLYGLALLCTLVAIIIMLEKIADRWSSR